jgi:hypothetical protein
MLQTMKNACRLVIWHRDQVLLDNSRGSIERGDRFAALQQDRRMDDKVRHVRHLICGP